MNATENTQVKAKCLTIEDIVAYLQVQPPAVRAMLRAGDIVGFQVGPRGLWRVEPADFTAYLVKQKQLAAILAKPGEQS